jgi:hypothetical protein
MAAQAIKGKLIAVVGDEVNYFLKFYKKNFFFQKIKP